jgi:hypothetical protein
MYNENQLDNDGKPMTGNLTSRSVEIDRLRMCGDGGCGYICR